MKGSADAGGCGGVYVFREGIYDLRDDIKSQKDICESLA